MLVCTTLVSFACVGSFAADLTATDLTAADIGALRAGAGPSAAEAGPPLFADHAPIDIQLSANWGKLIRDKDSKLATYPASLTIDADTATPRTLAVTVQPRGKSSHSGGNLQTVLSRRDRPLGYTLMSRTWPSLRRNSAGTTWAV